MRLYKCGNCGHVMEREEVDWRREKYDQEAFDEFPFCPWCGSDDIEIGQACEVCNAEPGDDFLGDLFVCGSCARHIGETMSKHIEQIATEEGLDYTTAKEWVLAWAEANW